jgi:hypothetical protein
MFENTAGRGIVVEPGDFDKEEEDGSAVRSPVLRRSLRRCCRYAADSKPAVHRPITGQRYVWSRDVDEADIDGTQRGMLNPASKNENSRSEKAMSDNVICLCSMVCPKIQRISTCSLQTH